MAKAELKTKKNSASVSKFLGEVEDDQRRADAQRVCEIMQKITKCEPTMWGDSIVGFGSYHYTYASGREGDWMLCGLSPRKQSLTLYIMTGFDHYDELMQSLGNFKTGKSCLYIKKLEDIHMPTLRKLIRASVTHLKKSNR